MSRSEPLASSASAAGSREGTVAGILAEAKRRFREASFEVESREASLILGEVLGLGEAQILARSRERLPEAAAGRFRALVERRLRGEPVAYLFGEREFYGRPFHVDPRVLVPRPETEHLIDAALALDTWPTARVLDVGTGSGCIAVTLALERSGARVWATDLSPSALAVTRQNAVRHGAQGRVLPVATDLTAGLDLRGIDLLVSNPPYVDPADTAALSPEVRDFEPHLALFSPQAGRGILKRLLTVAEELRSGCHALFEIGYDQADWLTAEVAARPLELVELITDYGGIPRTAVLRRI